MNLFSPTATDKNSFAVVPCLCLKPPSYSSSSLRVTHPDAVVIGLLCVDVARTFGVPQGSGSLCLDVLLYKQVLWEQKRRCKIAQKQQWMHGMGSQKTIPTVDVQAISRLFHKLLTAKLFCVSHNKNNGDKWGKLRKRWTLCVCLCLIHNIINNMLTVTYCSIFKWTQVNFHGFIMFGIWQRTQTNPGSCCILSVSEFNGMQSGFLTALSPRPTVNPSKNPSIGPDLSFFGQLGSFLLFLNICHFWVLSLSGSYSLCQCDGLTKSVKTGSFNWLFATLSCLLPQLWNAKGVIIVSIFLLFGVLCMF